MYLQSSDMTSVNSFQMSLEKKSHEIESRESQASNLLELTWQRAKDV